MKELYCFSKCEFDNYCENHGWSDDNIPQDAAFISICGTPDCQKYYLEEEEPHYFKSSGNDVLNLNFDDISTDKVEWHGHTFYGLSKEQAISAVNFIERNKRKNFYIHCRAGQSRSQGFVKFILDMYPDCSWKIRDDNPCRTPNMDVVCKLKEQYRLLGYYYRDLLEGNGYLVNHVNFYDGLGVEDSEYTYTFSLHDNNSFDICELHYFPDEEMVDFPLKAVVAYNGYQKVVKLFKTFDELFEFLESEYKKYTPDENK